jgi:hypothetical protein
MGTVGDEGLKVAHSFHEQITNGRNDRLLFLPFCQSLSQRLIDR